MGIAKERVIATLGALTLAAAIVLLVRLDQKARRRKVVRDNTFSKLRESGEYLLPPVETAQTNAPA
jgi:hypothetical protein